MSKYGDQSLDPKDWETQPQSDIPFVPHPEESANILERAGWTHRWNTLLNCREWRYYDDPWEKSTPRIEARIRGNIRRVDAMHGNDNASPFNVRPRIIAMQSIWGEVTAGLDAWPDQQFTPAYITEDPLPLDHAILPWYAWLQRRYLPGSASLWQPEIVVKPGAVLLPIEIAQYVADVFYVMPLKLAGGASGRRSRRVKHQDTDKPIVIYTDEENGIVLPDPVHGLASAIYWFNIDPYLVMEDIVETQDVKAERPISEWAATMAERIVAECQSGKSINEYLYQMLSEEYADVDEVIKATRAGTLKAMVGEITYCLREWYGWESKKEGKSRTMKWHAPEEDQDVRTI